MHAIPGSQDCPSGETCGFDLLSGRWACVGPVTNVMPNGMGTYTADQHLFSMLGSNGTSPGGHTVFCNDNPMNGWIPVCAHVMGAK